MVNTTLYTLSTLHPTRDKSNMTERSFYIIDSRGDFQTSAPKDSQVTLTCFKSISDHVHSTCTLEAQLFIHFAL